MFFESLVFSVELVTSILNDRLLNVVYALELKM